MSTALKTSVIPGLKSPYKAQHKISTFASRPNRLEMASVLCFDGLEEGTTGELVALSGVTAGTACSISGLTPFGALLFDQKQSLKIVPDPTQATITGHSFFPFKAMVCSVYHYFEGEWPVEDDFNFFELTQNGNIILALRIGRSGGQSVLSIIDADGGSTQIGALDLIQKDTLHLFQVWFENIDKTDLWVDVDNVKIIRSGNVPQATSSTKFNFCDPMKGDLTPLLRNADTSPSLGTTTYSPGAFFQRGGKGAALEFEPGNLISYGKLSSGGTSTPEFNTGGGASGDTFDAGTISNAGDLNLGTAAEYSPNKGGAWMVDITKQIHQATERIAASHNWIYSTPDDGLGPAACRLLLGSTKEFPSNAEIEYIETPMGVQLNVHHQENISRDLNPNPIFPDLTVMGFEAIGIAGSTQRVKIVESYSVIVLRGPFLSANTGLSVTSKPGNVWLNTHGEISIGKLGLFSQNKVMVLEENGFCEECIDPENIFIDAGVVICACEGNGVDEDIDWDLSDLQGVKNLGPACGRWIIRMWPEETGFNGPIHFEGRIDECGRLIDLPSTIPCLFCHSSVAELSGGPS